MGGPGQHGLWKDPRVAKNASTDINYYIRLAQAAEHALFDALFIVDSQFINSTYPAHYLNRLEPLTLLSAVATHTRHIGLVGTASSTYNSPFNLARRFASLDHISGGRAGWNVVTSFDTGTARNFGLDEHLDYTTRYGRALEFVQVARGLWDSYEDDAFPTDVERGVFLDPAKLHDLDHAGEHFKIAGPLNLSRSPQGQPVIFQAGVSEEGRDLAARVAEGIFAPGGTLEQARDYYADIKKRTAAYGRDPDHVKILIHGGPVVAATDEAARHREREIFEEDDDFDRNLALLGRSFGAYDFSAHDLDAPFPEVAHRAEKGGRTGAAQLRPRSPVPPPQPAAGTTSSTYAPRAPPTGARSPRTPRYGADRSTTRYRTRCSPRPTTAQPPSRPCSSSATPILSPTTRRSRTRRSHCPVPAFRSSTAPTTMS
ncbi:NtaA/DmoA family FMN-dependent monooxygenase [Streptomyces sp. NPDC020794]|uniref:NtaA/DmoA family FMN-dependent monooxygenase n=1 Tax=unclassified Streptomyces TaxID=2593676 RepID=UPI0036E02A61